MATPYHYNELFRREDPRFLAALRQADAMPELAEFAVRWYSDRRPWARDQLFRYVNQPWDRPGHEPLVKHLFKQAEDAQDDELMAVFAVALDRLVRRKLTKRWQYDWQTRQSWEEWTLVTPGNQLRKPDETTTRYRWTTGHDAVVEQVPAKQPKDGRLFSYHTRYYLRRRAWRYFRRMGYQRPTHYPLAVARMLILYSDDDLAAGENLLDCWSLVHAGFHYSDVLEFTPSLVYLRDGRSLGELEPAPYFPELWRSADAFEILRLVMDEARSRAVRLWAVELLRRDHRERLDQLDVPELIRLLGHSDPEVQQLAAELFETAAGLASLPLATWLGLLETQAENVTAVEAVSRAMSRHVAPERLSLAECVRLASARPTPVARLGFDFLRQRVAGGVETATDRETLAGLADAECVAVMPELTAWALPLVGGPDIYERDHVLRFFDALAEPVRRAAWGWLDTAESAAAATADPVLWARLAETPFDDVRLRFIDALQRRADDSSRQPGGLETVWTSVLLGVHRGGRQKLRAVRQIAAAVERDPQRAAALMPVLAVAVRSVRQPERREALAALVSLGERCPALSPLIETELPELRMTD